MSISLVQLLQPWIQIPVAQDVEIQGLSLDSRTLQAGQLFIYYLVASNNMQAYAQTAIEKGAAAIICDVKNRAELVNLTSQVPVIAIENLQPQVGLIAARYFNDPSKDLYVAGVTGTNGKTSISHFIARSLTQLHQPCGIVGTLGNGFPDHLQASIFTTQLPVELQSTIAALKQQNAQAIAMEVSSHGLDQDRVAGIHFDVGIFTNLSRDHLDYHQTMENYAQAKRRLFLQPGIKQAVINADDAFGQKLLDEFSTQLQTMAYSLQGPYKKCPTIYIKKLNYHAEGWSAEVITPAGEGKLNSKLLGDFNISNLLAVLGVLLHKKIPLAQALEVLSLLTTVPGRMQVLGGNGAPLVVVDYSHTPDSLEKALVALRKHCQGKLWSVFGCGGDRDAGKRPIMAQIAQQHADVVVVTSDNPRTEDAKKIIDQICAGFKNYHTVHIEPDRAAAIKYAIQAANPNDVVLIAGKGHEDYQIIGTTRIHFSDAEHVIKNLELKKEKL